MARLRHAGRVHLVVHVLFKTPNAKAANETISTTYNIQQTTLMHNY